MKGIKKLDGKAVLFFSAVVLVIILDRITKFIIVHNQQGIEVIEGLFNIVMTTNTGAAFSMLEGYNSILLFIALIVVGVILFNYPKIPDQRLPVTAFALITGGAIGNITDRVMLGYVVDFINFSFWPSFNVADSAISIGAVLLIWWIVKKQ